MTIPSTSSPFSGDTETSEISATISGIDLAYLESVAASLSTENASSTYDWLIDTTIELNRLDSSTASDDNLQILSASAQLDDTQTSPAPFSASNYCEENLAVCVAPPVAFVLLVAIITLFVKRRNKKRQAAISSVQETMAAQHTHQNNWYFSQEAGQVQNHTPHQFKEPQYNKNNDEEEGYELKAAPSTTVVTRRTADPVPRQQRRLTQPPQQRPTTTTTTITLSDTDDDGEGNELDLEAYLDATETADL